MAHGALLSDSGVLRVHGTRMEVVSQGHGLDFWGDGWSGECVLPFLWAEGMFQLMDKPLGE